MKDQLQLQEIAGYLPYGLRIETKYGTDNLIGIMFSDDTDYNSTKKTTHNVNHPLANTDTHCLEFYEIKPILRPMSDFFDPNKSYIEQMFDTDSTIECQKDGFYDGMSFFSDPCFLPYVCVQVLLKYHFDIHNLIERGLAISIHDINLNHERTN